MEYKYAENYIKNIIPEFILETKPVIAGGFAYSLYMTELAIGAMLESKSMKEEREIIVEDFLNREFTFLDYSDIDMFYLNSSYEENKHIIDLLSLDLDISVIKNTIEEKVSTTSAEASIINNDIKFIGKGVAGDNNSKLFTFRGKNSKNGFDFFATNTKDSKFATTYTISTGSVRSHSIMHNTKKTSIIQIVKKKSDDIQSLLDSFDLACCSIAWHDGKFYFGKSFEKQLKSKELFYNDIASIKKMFFGKKIFQALRTFKYSKRTGKSLSKETVDYMSDLILDCLNVQKEIEKDQEQIYTPYAQTMPSINTILGNVLANTITPNVKKQEYKKKKIKLQATVDGYEEQIVAIDSPTVKSLVAVVISKIEDLSYSEYWGPEKAVYFVGHSEDRFVKSMLEKLMLK